LHGESGQDEALIVLLDLGVRQVDLKLEFKLLERPVIVLGDCLASGGQVSVRV
jgi:hypothetical protein